MINVASLYPHRALLLAISVIGFLCINVPFIYIVVFSRDVYNIGMTNGLAQLFMGEAMILMVLFAFLIHRAGWKTPGWKVFVILSFLGSLAFSVPFFLYLYSKVDHQKADV